MCPIQKKERNTQSKMRTIGEYEKGKTMVRTDRSNRLMIFFTIESDDPSVGENKME